MDEHGESAHGDAYLSEVDASQLNALVIAHYVIGGVGMFLALIPLVYVGIGFFLMSGAVEEEVPVAAGGLLIGMGVLFFVIGEVIAVVLILSGYHINHRTGYMFSLVVAALSCLNMPVGTVLGVCTLIVLNRDSVKAAYGLR